MTTQYEIEDETNSLETVLHSIAALANDFLEESQSSQTPVRRPVTAEQIRDVLSTTPPERGRPLASLLGELREILEHSVRTGHRRFANQLFVGADPAGIVGEWITALLDTTMATYEMAPVATVLECELIGEMCRRAGFEEGEGILTPGGSISNLMAVMAARDAAYPKARTEGMAGMKPPAIFTSEEAHYSLGRAANLLGLGGDAVYTVGVDDVGRMQPELLAQRIAEARAAGRKPFFVCATAGTTVAGAYDPIASLADICDANDLWLHVDGAYGGAVLLSSTHRGLMTGIERADSLTWCPHKMMGLPLVCSALLMRRPGLLRRSLSVEADYIFHDTDDRRPDLGPMSLQCGRRVDSVKLWLAWQVLGNRGLEERIDHFFSLSAKFADLVRNRQHFELVRQPQGCNVLFNFIPPDLRQMSDGPRRRRALDAVTRQIREVVNDAGKVMVNYGPVDGFATFRMVHVNPRTDEEDLVVFLDEIERVGTGLKPVALK